MKRMLGLLAATTLLATGAVAVGTGSVGAAATSTPVVPLIQNIELLPDRPADTAFVYAVHGLNLDGQTSQADGGTAVTVCLGDVAVDSDFQFGDISTALIAGWGVPVDVEVFLGAGADCTGTDPVITLATTIPEVEALALVATAGPDGELQLLPVVLDVSTPEACLEVVEVPDTAQNAPQGIFENDSSAQAVHAAAAGPVIVDVEGNEEELSFGESKGYSVPNGTYTVQVTLDGTPIVGPVDLDIPPCTLTVVYVVGNQPIAEEPTTTTTAPAPAADAVAARPAFTG